MPAVATFERSKHSEQLTEERKWQNQIVCLFSWNQFIAVSFFRKLFFFYQTYAERSVTFWFEKEHTITCWGTSLTYTCVEVYVCFWGLAHAYAKPPFPLQDEAFWHNQIARAALFYPWEYINFSLGAAFLLSFSMINMRTFLKALQNQSKIALNKVRINWMKAWTIEVS